MPSEQIKVITLGELLSRDGGSVKTGPFGTALKASEYSTTGVPLISVREVGHGEFRVDEKTPRVTEATTQRLPDYLLLDGDIVFARKGSVDRCARVRKHQEGWFLGSDGIRLRPPKSVDSRFLLYWFLSSQSKEWLNQQATGSTMASLNQAIICRIPIVLPSLQEQRAISATLAALDDKITLLRETNATLEAIAQTLFKSWFVDFDPVRAKAEGRAPEAMPSEVADLFPSEFELSELGEIPKGWRWSKLDDISEVGIGKTPPRKEPHWFSEDSHDVRWVSIRDMGESGAFISTTSEYLTEAAIERFNVRRVPAHTVLLSFKLTVGRVVITDGDMTTNEAIAHFKLDDESPLSSEFIYLYLKQFHYGGLSSTSSIADAVNSKTVKAIPVLVPNPAIAEAFQGHVECIFQRIKSHQKEILTLANLRDTLLPRLLSGKLHVAEAEVKEAA